MMSAPTAEYVHQAAATINQARKRRAHMLNIKINGDKDNSYLVWNFLTQQSFVCNLLVIDLLGRCTDWQEDTFFYDRLKIFPRTVVDSLIRDLVANGALVVEGQPAAMRDEEYSERWEWGDVAGIFHMGVRNPLYLSGEDIENHMAQRNDTKPSPPLYTTNDSFESVTSLPSFPSENPTFATMLARRSNREFSSTPIAIQQLADCLYSGLGITGFTEEPLFGRLPRKLTPSGGARNPYEGYVYSLNVEGLERGFYHYSATEHTLGLIKAEYLLKPHEIFGNQAWTDDAAAIIFLAANFERTMWKYNTPQAYRIVTLEAGHIAQNMVLAATAHGLLSTTTAAIHDSTIEQALGLTSILQSVMYGILIGKP
jgi:SagB-type dehydrogenase family enzyme